ncbi:hypothetical protein SLEP1_g24659 [Rubroshorea leprosula]|uniref:Uncharacterized protein n=1 Tax=Rubroshorea leprosula TaxID=152421 RepID=A0AAV5JGD2_9ROSI|nr:hypothetical protein SLEP1_g24659 [Rubroshorea leprosula]
MLKWVIITVFSAPEFSSRGMVLSSIRLDSCLAIQ